MTTAALDDFAKRFGLAVVGALFAANLFFIRGLVESIDTSSKAVILLEERVRFLTAQSASLTDLRIEISILKNGMTELKERFPYYPKRRTE